jgi:hypothetical protein
MKYVHSNKLLIGLLFLITIISLMIAFVQPDKKETPPVQTSQETLSQPLSVEAIQRLARQSKTDIFWFGVPDSQGAVRAKTPLRNASGQLELVYFNSIAQTAFERGEEAFTVIVKTTVTEGNQYNRLYQRAKQDSKVVESKGITIFYPEKGTSPLLLAIGRSHGKTIIGEIAFAAEQPQETLKEAAARISYIPHLP